MAYVWPMAYDKETEMVTRKCQMIKMTCTTTDMAICMLQEDDQAKKNVKEKWKWPHPTLESKFKLINLGGHSLLLTWRSSPTGAEGCKQPWQCIRSQSISQCHRVHSLKSRLKGGFVQVDINTTEGWHWHWTTTAHDKERKTRKMSDSKWGQLFMSMQVHLSSEKLSMPIKTHDARLDMEWKYLTFGDRDRVLNENRIVVQDMEHPRWSEQGTIVTMASEIPRQELS